MPPIKAKATGKKGKAAAKGAYQLADPLPAGEILTDIFKKQWRLGQPIGSGGFGLLYLASKADESTKADPQYVMKVEPHSNGPLFVEVNVYQRLAKPEMITKWMSSKKLKTLGIPKYITSGGHDVNGQKNRFMVMERFGSDLQKIFEANGKRFSTRTVFQLAVSLLYSLEYIHDHKYAHADVKASNLLLGYAKGTTNTVFLVDFGLASKYTQGEDSHKEYKEDKKRAHDGTVEFTSRDAHRGVAPSRRGDLEILGYCLLQWLCSRLPWEDKLDNKEYVKNKKIRYMDNLEELMDACFPEGDYPEEIVTYLEYVNELEYEEEPDYDHARQIFLRGMKRCGYSADAKLDLTSTAIPTKKGGVKRRSKANVDSPSTSGVKPERGVKRKSEAPATPSSPAPRGRGRGRGATAGKAKSPRLSNQQSAAALIIPAMVQPPMSVPGEATPGLTNGHTAGRKKATEKLNKKRKIEVLNACTQTSPGLKGLPRSWKKDKYTKFSELKNQAAKR